MGVRAALGPANKTDIPLSLLDDSDVERDLAVARLAQMIGDHNGSESGPQRPAAGGGRASVRERVGAGGRPDAPLGGARPCGRLAWRWG